MNRSLFLNNLNNPEQMFVSHLDDDARADVFMLVASEPDSAETGIGEATHIQSLIRVAYGRTMDETGIEKMWPITPYREAMHISPWATIGGAIRAQRVSL